MRATELLRQDHEHVHQLFLQLEQSAGSEERQRLLDQIADEIEVHAKVEEELFYPALAPVSRRVEDARAGHQHVRSLIGEVQGRDTGSEGFMPAVQRLKQAVLIHVAEEEGAMFLEAGRLGPGELESLGAKIADRQQALKTSLLQRGVRAIKKAAQKVA